MRHFYLLAGAVLSFFIPLASHAQENSACQVIHWKPDHVYTLTGEINHATHLLLPVEKAVDPVVGNSELWLVESKANHVYFKPTDKTMPDGEQTTLSFIGVNNHSYEFILKRVEANAPPCVVVKDNHQLINSSWTQYQTPSQKVITVLARELQREKDQQHHLVSEQQKRLSAYRSHIYTQYTIKAHYGWWSNHLINSIYDDGRWTYIRLNNDDKNLMNIYSIVSGKKELLQYHYDSMNKVYRIAGIYPQLTLIYDNNTIDICRKD